MNSNLMEPVVGKHDIVLFIKGNKSNKIRVGQVEKVSTYYKERLQDGKHHDICTEPIYSWLNLKIVRNEEIFRVKPNETQVCSRHFRIGDIIKYEDKIGYVLNIFQKPTVKFVGHNFILHKVDPNQLTDPWMSFVTPKRPILYQGWIGKIGLSVSRKLFLVDNLHRFSCSWDHFSLFCLQEGLISKSQCTFEVNGFSFYPGRKFFVTKQTVIKRMYDGLFISMDIFPEVDKFNEIVPIEIIRTELSPFPVSWLINTSGRKSLKPPDFLFPEDLNKITWIRPFDFLKLGDVRMLNLESKNLINVHHTEQWKDYLRNRYCFMNPDMRQSMKSLQNIKASREYALKMLDYSCREIPVEVVYLTSEVEIGWIDGTKEILDSRQVLPVRPTTLPIGSFVQNIEEEDTDWKKVYGVVQIVTLNVHQRDVALVKWIKKQTNKDGFEDSKSSISEVPLKFLRKHSYYDFTSETKKNVVVTSVTSSENAPLIGFIINSFPDGRLRIRTTNGKLYSAWPDEIVRVTPTI